MHINDTWWYFELVDEFRAAAEFPFVVVHNIVFGPDDP